MDKLNRLLNGTLAGQIAKKLDEADGKKDGKISASIWNSFVKDKGGKEIKQFINVYDAMNSITTYAVRESKKSTENKSINQMATDWLNNLNENVVDNIPSHVDNSNMTNVPKTAEVPQKMDQEMMHSDLPDLSNIDKNKIHSGKKETVQGKDGKYYTYDNGTVFIYDSKELCDKKAFNLAIDFDKDNNFTGFTKAEYNQQGKITFWLDYDKNGNFKGGDKSQYNSDGKESSDISYKSNGEITGFINYSYDKDGNKIKYEYDKNGELEVVEKTDKNGIVYRYNEDGTFLGASKEGDMAHGVYFYWDENGNLEK